MAKMNLSFFSDKTKILGTWTSKRVLLEDVILVKTDGKRYLLGLSEAEDHLPFLKSYNWAIFLQHQSVEQDFYVMSSTGGNWY